MGLARVPTGAMAIPTQEPAPQAIVKGREQREQKRIGQRRQQEQFLARLPLPQARTLERQLTLVLAPRQLNLPAARIGKHDPPGILSTSNRLSGEQIPGQASF